MLFYLVRFALKIFADLFLEFLGKNRHGSVLSADVSRYLDGEFMRLSHALATKNACHESAREGVACAYGICYLYFWSLDEGNFAWGKDITAIDTAS